MEVMRVEKKHMDILKFVLQVRSPRSPTEAPEAPEIGASGASVGLRWGFGGFGAHTEYRN
jgi:hypothetical protein